MASTMTNAATAVGTHVAWAPSVVPDKKRFASCSVDRCVIIWTQTGGPEETWEPKLLNRFDAPVWRLAWSVSGCFFVVNSGYITVAGSSNVTLWEHNLDGDWSHVSTVYKTMAAAVVLGKQRPIPRCIVKKEAVEVQQIHAIEMCPVKKEAVEVAPISVRPSTTTISVARPRVGERFRVKKEAAEMQQRTNGTNAVEMSPVKKEVVEKMTSFLNRIEL